MQNAPSRSLAELLKTVCYKWTGRPAMMRRKDAGWETISYAELYEIVRKFSAAIQSFGAKRGDKLAILSENCPEWAFVDWACQTLGVTVVPIFPTLPADQVEYIVRDSGAKIVVAGDDTQAAKTSGIDSARTIRLHEVLSLSQTTEPPTIKEWENEIDRASEEDVATIIYTSGTTGKPKGAMLPHRAYTFLADGALSALPLTENDVFLSFLPMSHVYERFAGQVLPISCGACIAYSKSLASLASDMVAVRPTVMLCVPRFLEATREKIVDSVRKSPPIRQKLFNLALSQGVKRAKGEFAPLYPLTDLLVGKKIRERVGGRIRFFVSGGAALPTHVAEFYMAFGLNVLQGYGLTETCAASCVNHPDRSKYWTVGEPLRGVEVSIAEDGEILIRGHSVMKGYHNLPKETAEAIDDAGWFHTGDIGEWEGAHLKITDRKKDLLVLGNGKNVAPQPIENRLKASPLIAEAVVLGDGMDHCVALVVPSFDAWREAMKKAGLSPSSDDAVLAASPEAKALVKKEIDAVNKTMASFEMVKKFALLDRPFSIEAGELTPSLKVKRKVVMERHKEIVDQL